MCRLNRNKLPTLNPDMTIEYAVKIPVMSSMYGISDLDIEWIVSATSSSGSVSNLSSARSQKSSMFGEIGNTNSSSGANSMHRMASFIDNNNIPLSFKQRRIPSASKRLPWEQQTSIESDVSGHSNTASNAAVNKSSRSREVAPLKAFPLSDDPLDFANNG